MMGKRKADPGFKLCNICEPPGSGKMNLYGYPLKPTGRREKCTACDGEGQTPYRDLEVEPRRMRVSVPKVRTSREWSDMDVKLMEKYFEVATTEQLEEMFPNRTLRAIRAKGHNMGMSRAHVKKPKKDGQQIVKPWSLLEEKIIESNWRYCTPRQLENMLPGRTVDQIKTKAMEMGLTG